VTLALLGGSPVVFRRTDPWPPDDPDAAKEIARMIGVGEISYYGEEGHIKRLEEQFEEYHDVAFALATSSGTAALHSAFVACGLRAGDEVVAPTHTFLATVMPIFAADGTPVLVDCEEDNEGISPNLIEEAITPRTRAIVVTHLWGHPVDMDPIMELARSYQLKVIEDCSHAHGATYRGRLVGTIGDVGCFSLQGKKAVSGGQGGILITNDCDIYERALLIGHFRVRAEQGVRSAELRPFVRTGWGLNYRMHPFSAVLAAATMSRLDEVIARRQDRQWRLLGRLKEIPGIVEPKVRPEVTMGAWYGVKPRFAPEELDGVPMGLYLRALQAEGVEVDRPGSAPLHVSPIFTGTAVERMPFASLDPATRRVYRPGDMPVSERIHKSAMSLPTFTYEPVELVDAYADAFARLAENVDVLRRLARGGADA
jgi:dTDP-4-amino-4,6-dideoxygalactose transaminase